MTLALSVVPSRVVMYPNPPSGSNGCSAYSSCSGTSVAAATATASLRSVAVCSS